MASPVSTAEPVFGSFIGLRWRRGRASFHAICLKPNQSPVTACLVSTDQSPLRAHRYEDVDSGLALAVQDWPVMHLTIDVPP